MAFHHDGRLPLVPADRDRRGHAFALFDQEQTKRVTEKKQPGAGIQFHASTVELYLFAGDGDITKGFEKVCALPYPEVRNMKDEHGAALVEHSLACIDCHDPSSMELRVTRPGFMKGIAALKAKEGIQDYDVNRDASRQEMRSFVCGQCHVEYYDFPPASPGRSSTSI
jgi:nitrite reductase (cytochrome c-552)